MIGAGGRMLKDVGTAARIELEEILGWKVFLELLVKVDRDWTRNSCGELKMGPVVG